MLFGGQIKSIDHIELLMNKGFDFGEVLFRDPASLQFWRDSGVVNRFGSGFFLLAHGPSEGPPNDLDNLRTKYLPELKDSVDAARLMEIAFVTVHLWMDARFVKPNVISGKKQILRELVDYGREKGVSIGLENLSEPADDLADVLDAVPGLLLTLDVGHAQLLSRTNTSFGIIKRLGRALGHVHIHDNRGGKGPNDDLHLPVGDGAIDFPAILQALVASGYNRTITFEVQPGDLERSRNAVQDMLTAARAMNSKAPALDNA
jgi:sugar phosphate isomerase/epimerase